MKYNHKEIEPKWQKIWEKEKLYSPKEMSGAVNPFYNLWMFPYPSAEGLHAGHAFASTGSDVFGRFMRMKGHTTFQPIGYDSFGIHSENYAIKVSETPQVMLKRTTANYERQLRSLGLGYDWTRTVTTSDEDYYKWTQWVFTTLFKAGLAYRKEADVNWCPSCKTVLADEQVIDGKCERCGTVVERKSLAQWFFRITDYADRLLNNLDKIDWTEKVKLSQKNWIGKAEGLNISFILVGNIENSITVWTRFWETIFGATFLVVSPEYLLKNLAPSASVDSIRYAESALEKSLDERRTSREKTGVDTKLKVVNPATGEEIPVWVSDYVLEGVGTGAVMGVPAHDKRDFEFARKYNLPIVRVVVPVTCESILMGTEEISDQEFKKMDIETVGIKEDGTRKIFFPRAQARNYEEFVAKKLKPGYWNEYFGDDIVFIFKHKDSSIETLVLNQKNETRISQLTKEFTKGEVSTNPWDMLCSVPYYSSRVVYESGGILINSGKFNSLMSDDDGKVSIKKWLAKEGIGEITVNYHLRDWLISRQRYWGAPIPMIYCEKCAKKGNGWLAKNKGEIHENSKDWSAEGWYPVEDEALPVKLPVINDYKPKGEGSGPLADHPEFYKVACPECGEEAKRETDICDTFLDSSWYFLRYPTVGAKDADKNPFDPEITKKWLPVNLYFGGAEHSVLHLMYARFVTQVLFDLKYLDFEEPFPKFYAHGLMIKDGAKMSKSRGNVVNPDTYIEKFGADTMRLYLMFMGPMDGSPDFRDTGIEGMERFLKRVLSLFETKEEIKSSSKVISMLNKTVKKVTSDMEVFHYNTAVASIMELVNFLKDNEEGAGEDSLLVLTQLLSPFAPHITEEIWREKFKKNESIHVSSWPTHDEDLIVEEEVVIAIQVNGKLRGQIEVSKEISENEESVVKKAKENEQVKRWLESDPKKTIFIKGKLINFVI